MGIICRTEHGFGVAVWTSILLRRQGGAQRGAGWWPPRPVRPPTWAGDGLYPQDRGNHAPDVSAAPGVHPGDALRTARGHLKRVEVQGILCSWSAGPEIHGLAACAHLGGPLTGSPGRHVVCPWHSSTHSLTDRRASALVIQPAGS